MLLIRIFLLGIGVLSGAILLNFTGSIIGLSNWYDFIAAPHDTTLFSYIWLFIVYPAGLGICAYIVAKMFRIL